MRPGPDNDYQNDFVTRVAHAFARITGASLDDGDPSDLGRRIWFGDFALLTHRGDTKATLNYGNQFALRLWECDWDTLTNMPSAATAPPDARAMRADMMDRVVQDGFVTGYSGRRISRTGKMFTIQGGIIWRLLDENGTDFGVGAIFRDYEA